LREHAIEKASQKINYQIIWRDQLYKIGVEKTSGGHKWWAAFDAVTVY
jgi:hypothetical protein